MPSPLGPTQKQEIRLSLDKKNINPVFGLRSIVNRLDQSISIKSRNPDNRFCFSIVFGYRIKKIFSKRLCPNLTFQRTLTQVIQL